MPRHLLVTAICKAGIHGGCDSLFVEHPQPAPPPAWRQHMKSCGVGVAQRSDGCQPQNTNGCCEDAIFTYVRTHVRLSILQLVFRKMRGAPRTAPPCIAPTACCMFTEVQQVFSITTTPGGSQEAPQVEGRRSNY